MSNNTGLLFDIQRFSIHDGPGIRTTLFFKGCALRCAWCHNPESLLPYRQLNYNAKACKLCGACVMSVSGNGIVIKDNKLVVDFSKHNQNFSLIDVCPNGAYGVYGQEYGVEELVNICIKDIDYYQESGGGITFSGGEALNQIDFLLELGQALRVLNLNICLDVSGFGSLSSYKKSLLFTDTYLLDYKITNSSDYLPYIGREFNIEQVLSFLQEYESSVILRCPIIPSVNNHESHFQAIANISHKYSVIKRIDILPYHNLSKQKQFLGHNLQKKFEIADKNEKKYWQKMIKEYKITKVYLDGKLCYNEI